MEASQRLVYKGERLRRGFEEEDIIIPTKQSVIGRELLGRQAVDIPRGNLAFLDHTVSESHVIRRAQWVAKHEAQNLLTM